MVPTYPFPCLCVLQNEKKRGKPLQKSFTEFDINNTFPNGVCPGIRQHRGSNSVKCKEESKVYFFFFKVDIPSECRAKYKRL